MNVFAGVAYNEKRVGLDFRYGLKRRDYSTECKPHAKERCGSAAITSGMIVV